MQQRDRSVLERKMEKMICGDRGEEKEDVFGWTNWGLLVKKATIKDGKKGRKNEDEYREMQWKKQARSRIGE